MPSLNGVQEERIRKITRGKEQQNELMVFAVQTGMTSKGGFEVKDKSIICTNWKNLGHRADPCFQLIDYLDWRVID